MKQPASLNTNKRKLDLEGANEVNDKSADEILNMDG